MRGFGKNMLHQTSDNESRGLDVLANGRGDGARRGLEYITYCIEIMIIDLFIIRKSPQKGPQILF